MSEDRNETEYVNHAGNRDNGENSTKIYSRLRDLDPAISCLIRGMNMGIIIGFFVGIISGFCTQKGFISIPFFRLYGTLTGIEFYAVWTVVCICLGILVFGGLSVLMTPWKHLK